MHHDLPNEQPQQFRGQIPDVGVLLRQGDEVVGAAHLLPQPPDGCVLFWDLFLQRGHLLRVAAGESLELLRRDPPQYAVLIQPLEDGVQFPGPLIQGGQLLLPPADLPLELGGLLPADVRRELLGMFPGPGGHPPDVLQHHLVQDTFPNVVSGADLGALLLVSAAGEVVVGGRHGVGPVQNHRGTAVGADHQPGVLVELLHFGRASPVLPHPLDNIPSLPVNDGLMAALNDHAFISGMLHTPLVLVGFGTVLHVDGVADVQFILQHICHRVAVPVIGLGHVQPRVPAAEPLVGVHGGAQHLLPPEDAGDLAGAVAGGTQGKNAAHYGGGLLVYKEPALGVLVLFVTIGCPGAKPLPALGLGPLHRPDLPAGVPHEPLVEQVFEGHQLAALDVFRVHIVVDGDVAHPELGKPLLDVQPGVQLVAAQTG